VPTKEEVSQWYDVKYYDAGKVRRPYDAYPFILDYIKAGDEGALLDIACGAGFLLLAASRRGLQSFGIGISPEAVRMAREVSPASQINAGSAEELKYADGFFDYVTCLGALEHFLDMNKALQEMKRVAKPDATFCLVVPNSRFLLWTVLGKRGTEQQDIKETLLTLREWKDVFTSNGFRVTGVRRDKWYLKFPATSVAGFVKRVVALILGTVIPLRYDYQFAFILKKA
jgi:SAM-dependent methyltransferase